MRNLTSTRFPAGLGPCKRLNGRMMMGDDRDDSVRVYEFDGSDGRKLWRGWRNHFPDELNTAPTAVDFPARTDTLDTVALNYDGNESPGPRPAATDGWLDVTLSARPVFITEPETAVLTRPDVAVDSVRFRPHGPRVLWPETVHVWVKNRDENTGTPPGCTAA